MIDLKIKNSVSRIWNMNGPKKISRWFKFIYMGSMCCMADSWNLKIQYTCIEKQKHDNIDKLIVNSKKKKETIVFVVMLSIMLV